MRPRIASSGRRARWVVPLFSAFAARAALAQDGGNTTRAQQLFDEALQLADQNRWGEACPKFRESLAADPGVGTLLNVAACSAREGKALEATKEYRRALQLNTATRDPDRKRAVDQQVAQALKELSARVGRVTVTVTPSNAAARIAVDGTAATEGSGQPIDVEVGAHVIRVEADGYKPVDARVSIAPGQEASLPVNLVPMGSGIRSAPAPSGGGGGGGELRTAGIVTGLFGAASLTTGAILLGFAADRASAIRTECGKSVEPPACPAGDPQVANDLSSEGSAFEIGGFVTVGVGGAAIATGILLLIIDAAGAPSDAGVKVTAGASSEGAFVGLGGTF